MLEFAPYSRTQEPFVSKNTLSLQAKSTPEEQLERLELVVEIDRLKDEYANALASKDAVIAKLESLLQEKAVQAAAIARAANDDKEPSRLEQLLREATNRTERQGEEIIELKTKRKALIAEIRDLKAEAKRFDVPKLKSQLAASKAKAKELQTANATMNKQLREHRENVKVYQGTIANLKRKLEQVNADVSDSLSEHANE